MRGKKEIAVVVFNVIKEAIGGESNVKKETRPRQAVDVRQRVYHNA